MTRKLVVNVFMDRPGSTRITIEARGEPVVRINIGSAGGSPLRIETRGRDERADAPPAPAVSKAMERAGVATFLSAERVERLGASLTSAYLAMVAARRAEGGDDDDGSGA